MALTAKTTYLHPQNWDGNAPESGGFKKVILYLTGICDGDTESTDESDAIKLDISELRKIDGTAPTRTSIEYIKWSIEGFYNVKLSWDRAPENTIAVLTGHGKICQPIMDQSEEGDRTGDIMLTTDGAAEGAAYSIEICVKLK